MSAEKPLPQSPSVSEARTEHLRHWMRASVCSFAKRIASGTQDLRYLEIPDDIERAQLAPRIDALAYASANAVADQHTGKAELLEVPKLVCITAPWLTTSRGIARFIAELLAADARWTASPFVSSFEEGDTLAIDLGFRTRNGRTSNVMGLAPLGCMPITRRAPLTAFIVWAGGPGSEKLATTDPTESLGVTDVPTGLTDEEFEERQKKTASKWRSLYEPRAWSEMKKLFKLSFCLERAEVESALGAP